MKKSTSEDQKTAETEDGDENDEEEPEPIKKPTASVKPKKKVEVTEEEDSSDPEDTQNDKFKTGDLVYYKDMECEVIKVDGKGLLTVEDEDGEDYRGISPTSPDIKLRAEYER